MSKKAVLWTVAKIASIAAVAALALKYERDNPESEATAAGSLGKAALMWALGFAVATAGGIAVIGSIGGAAAIIGGLAVAVAVIALILGAGREALDEADGIYRTGRDAVTGAHTDLTGDSTIINGDTGEPVAADGGEPAE